jgi:hypothetical protein
MSNEKENDVRTDCICQICRFHTNQIFLFGKWVCMNCARPQKEVKDETTILESSN